MYVAYGLAGIFGVCGEVEDRLSSTGVSKRPIGSSALHALERAIDSFRHLEITSQGFLELSLR